MNSYLRVKVFLVFSLVLLNVCIWAIVSKEDRGGLLTVSFLDVGQGDAIFIDAPNGNQLLIDGGKDRQVLGELGQVLPFYDREIDLVVATHPDADHVGGLSHVLDVYDIGVVLGNGQTSETSFYKAFTSRIDGKDIPVIVAERGMVVDLGGGVFLKIRSPQKGMKGESNDLSIVAELVYGSTTVMLTGDATLRTESLLLRDPKSLDSDVLKVGHHGSRTSTGSSFLAAVSPAYAIISAGKDNQYHHPNEEIVARLKAFGTNILGTMDSGTIRFVSDGNVIVPQ